jgi:hypothetical protein
MIATASSKSGSGPGDVHGFASPTNTKISKSISNKGTEKRKIIIKIFRFVTPETRTK